MLMDWPYTTTRTVSVGEGGACNRRAVRATYGVKRAVSPVSGTGKNDWAAKGAAESSRSNAGRTGNFISME
jgi:hypothetical protein